MKYSIVIATYKRAADLRDTLDSLSKLRPDGPWEVIVVDNNSPDDTRQVVDDAARSFPVELRYLFEAEQGRSPALNAGMRAARGSIIVTTDDDVRVPEDWVNRAAEGLERLQCDYVGGRVLPIWGAPRPAWIPNHGGKQWAVIALLDYGPEPVEFGARVPLGVNMAFTRAALDRAGLLDPQHRQARRHPAWAGGPRVVHSRAQSRLARVLRAGDVPRAHHPCRPAAQALFPPLVLLARDQPGVAVRASGLDMEAPEQRTLDFVQTCRTSAGVPRYLYRKALRAMFRWARDTFRRDALRAFQHEMWLWFFAGIVRQRWKDSQMHSRAVPAAGQRG